MDVDKLIKLSNEIMGNKDDKENEIKELNNKIKQYEEKIERLKNELYLYEIYTKVQDSIINEQNSGLIELDIRKLVLDKIENNYLN